MASSARTKTTAKRKGTRLAKTMTARSLLRTIAHSATTPPAKAQDKPGAAPAGPISLQLGTRRTDAAANPEAHQPGRVLGQKVKPELTWTGKLGPCRPGAICASSLPGYGQSFALGRQDEVEIERRRSGGWGRSEHDAVDRGRRRGPTLGAGAGPRRACGSSGPSQRDARGHRARRRRLTPRAGGPTLVRRDRTDHRCSASRLRPSPPAKVGQRARRQPRLRPSMDGCRSAHGQR